MNRTTRLLFRRDNLETETGMLKIPWLLPFAAELESAHGGLVASVSHLPLCDCLSPSRLLPSALFHSATSGKRAKWTPHVSNQVVPCLDPSEGENVHVSCDGRYRTRATYPAAAPDPADPSPPAPLRPLVVSPLQTLTPIRNSQNNSRKSRRISL